MTKLAWLVLVVAACKGNEPIATQPAPPARPANGAERGDCVPGTGAGGTCEPGLLCLSNLCVRPPPADCQAVADTLTTMQLGNYAELEERQPLLTKYKGACLTAKISKDQGECIAKAKDQFAATQCAPAMFPERAAQGQGGCGPALAKLRTILDKALQGQTPVAGQVDVVGVTMGAMSASCAEDQWPVSLLRCMESMEDITAMSACNAQMSPALMQKLNARLATAATAMQPPPPRK